MIRLSVGGSLSPGRLSILAILNKTGNRSRCLGTGTSEDDKAMLGISGSGVLGQGTSKEYEGGASVPTWSARALEAL